jgi:hypothetical protein
VPLQADLQQIPTSSSLSLTEIVKPKNIFIDRSITVVNHLKIINKIDRYRQFSCKQIPGSGIIEITLEILTNKSIGHVVCICNMSTANEIQYFKLFEFTSSNTSDRL